MADTLNMLVHNKTAPKLIETNNFMVINGTLYQKSNLSSMKKAFSFGSDLGNNVLHISRSMHLIDDARIDKRFKEPLIHEDKYEENVSYIILNDQYSNVINTKSFLLKLSETEDDFSVLNQISFDNIILKEIFDITNQYIFVSGINLSNAVWNLYCISKSNFTVSKTITLTNNNASYKDNHNEKSYTYPSQRGCINVFENTESKLSFYVNSFRSYYGEPSAVGNGYAFTIVSVNKANLEYTKNDKNGLGGSIVNVNDSICWQDHTRNFYNINNKHYFLIWKQRDNCIYEAWFDSNNDFNKKTSSETNKNIFYSNTNSQMESFTKDDYFFYCIADETNSTGNILDYQGIHKFKIDGEFNLIYEKRINPSSTSRIISILFNEDYSIIIIGYYQSFDILIYEEETQDYVKVGKSFTGIKNVGLDSLNRLWYETTSGEIHTENFDDPQDVVVEFEKPYYSYLSGELETYVTFKARSATGVVPTGRYILRITTGNAYFKESGTNELVINYESMSQDDIHYPLMITGSKRIVCNVSFEKVW